MVVDDEVLRIQAQLMIEQVEAVEASSRRFRLRSTATSPSDRQVAFGPSLYSTTSSSSSSSSSSRSTARFATTIATTTQMEPSLSLADDLSTDSEENNDQNDKDDDDSSSSDDEEISLPGQSPTKAGTISSSFPLSFWTYSKQQYHTKHCYQQRQGLVRHDPSHSNPNDNMETDMIHAAASWPQAIDQQEDYHHRTPKELEILELRAALRRCQDAVLQIQANAELKVEKLRQQVTFWQQRYHESQTALQQALQRSSDILIRNDDIRTMKLKSLPLDSTGTLTPTGHDTDSESTPPAPWSDSSSMRVEEYEKRVQTRLPLQNPPRNTPSRGMSPSFLPYQSTPLTNGNGSKPEKNNCNNHHQQPLQIHSSSTMRRSSNATPASNSSSSSRNGNNTSSLSTSALQRSARQLFQQQFMDRSIPVATRKIP